MDNTGLLKWIQSTFLLLTSKTCPYGFEEDIMDMMITSGLMSKDILQTDNYGNYFCKIGDSKTIFTCHLDTVCKFQTEVKHVLDKNIIRTDKTTTLGADDKAGATILCWLIKNNIPGVYYFFVGEEVGCVGSTKASVDPKFKNYRRMISFDRRGTTSVITHQSYIRTCSDMFAKELSKQLNRFDLKYKPDDTGVYTDSAEFKSVIPECTNLSVGYYNEHSFDEHQDIEHLSKLADACIKVLWEELPTNRDFSITERKPRTIWSNSPGYSYNQDSHRRDYGYNDDWDDYPERDYRSYKRGEKFNTYENYDTYDYDEYEVLNGVGGYKRRRKYKLKDREKYPRSYGVAPLSTSDRVNNNHYKIMKEKLLESKMTASEIELIKDQYFDMQDSKDANFYNVLKTIIKN